MGTLTIRGLDDQVKADLRLRAARNGRSMEAEARAILSQALAGGSRPGLSTRLRERFRDIETDLELPDRHGAERSLPDFATDANDP